MTHNHALLHNVLKKCILHKSKDMHDNGHNSIIYNSQKAEKAPLPVSNIMDKYIFLHSCYGILYN